MASIAESESAIAEGRTFGLEDIRADDRWRAAAAMRPRPLSWTWTAATGTVATLAVSVVDVERRQGGLQRVSELGECLRQSVRQLGDRPMRTAQLDATDHRIKTVLKIVGQLA